MGVFSFFRKFVSTNRKQPDTLTSDEKEAIRSFAAGQADLRNECIAIHRTSVRNHGLRRGDPFFDFMSEVDSPCPDLTLRAIYRRILLQG
jgi:hypothetical protein